MDNADRGESGLCSHLETTTSIKRRHGLESCNLTIESLELKFVSAACFTMELLLGRPTVLYPSGGFSDLRGYYVNINKMHFRDKVGFPISC